MGIALVTARAAADLDDDMPGLLDACRDRGLPAEVAAWDDDAVDWSSFEACVVRSTWDYIDHYAEFLAWAAAVASVSMLLNPYEVIRWNTDKRYLADLAALGIPVVPSRFLDPGDRPTTESVRFDGTAEVVVKPCVGVGSKGAGRFSAGDPAALAHLRGLLDGGRAAMVQPYLSTVDEQGETALVVIDGEPSHAIRKGPLLEPGAPGVAGLFLPEHISERTASDDEVELGRRIVDALVEVPTLGDVGHPLVYARVDLLRADDGSLALLELELTEPSLFFHADPAAAGRLADAVGRRLG